VQRNHIISEQKEWTINCMCKRSFS